MAETMEVSAKVGEVEAPQLPAVEPAEAPAPAPVVEEEKKKEKVVEKDPTTEKKADEKPPKKEKKPKGVKVAKVSSHPSYLIMCMEAITDMKVPHGSTQLTISKYIKTNFDLSSTPEASVKNWVKINIHKGLDEGLLRADNFHPLCYHVTKEGKAKLAKETKKAAPKKAAKPKAKKAVKAESSSGEEEEEVKAKKPKKTEKKKKTEEEEKKKKKAPAKPQKRKLKDSEDDEEEPPKKKPRSPKSKAEPKKDKKDKKDKEEKKPAPKKRAPKKEAKKTEDAPGTEATTPAEKAPKAPKAKKAPASRKKKSEKEIAESMAPSAEVTMTGVAFNTTDLEDVRADVRAIIKNLLHDDNTQVGLVANKGAGESSAYALEVMEFTDSQERLMECIDKSFGEGSDWLGYYKMVLDSALSLPWAKCSSKYLILVGSHGTEVLVDRSLRDPVTKLETLGVQVFGFHHTQLELLEAILPSVH